MGQQTSKHHAPLTFGYVNRPDRSHSDSQDPEPHDRDPLDDNDDALNDFVLANPHLYRLEFTCQNNCGTKHKRQSTASSADEHPLGRSSTASRPESVIVATKVDQECKFCRQNKRLSLVRRDLAEDLAYIDETYYPDVIHYVPNDDVLESELLQMDAEDDDQQQPSHSDINWAKLTIGDVTPGRSRPRRLTGASLAVDLSGRALIKLSPSIGYLDNLTKLNLSHNQMSSLPRTIGYLRNLRVLNTSHNQLETLPDTISFLTKLTAINISHNRVTTLPSSIGSLPKLVVIIANDNLLTELPQEIANLHDLISLNIANNPLRCLPAGIGSLKTLRKLIVEGCTFDTEFTYTLNHDPPSLFEICARAAVRKEITVPAFLSEHIKEYFAKEQTCSFCGGPFFESSVTRGRFIERNARQQIALEYRLCSAHWSDEDDRVLAMFANPPDSSIRTAGAAADVNTDGLDSHSTGMSLRGFGRSRAQSDASNRSYNNLALSPSNSSQLSKRSNSSSSLMLYQQSGSYTDLSDSITIRSLKRQPSLPALPVPTAQPEASGAAAAASAAGSPPTRSSSPLAPRSARRPRASSSASVTRRLAGFLSPSPSSFSRSYSSSTLRQEQWNSSDRAFNTTPPATAANTMVQIDEQHDEADLSSPSPPFSQSNATEQDSAQRHPNGPMRLWMPGQSQSNASISTAERTDHPATARHRQQNHKQSAENPLRAGLAHLGARFSTNRDRSGTV